jgi:predicted phage terminase large subunit-like protein
LNFPVPSENFHPSSYDDWLKSLGLEGLSPDEQSTFYRLALRELAKTDVFAFGEYVYGYVPAQHHREMVDFVGEAVEHEANSVVLEPRGAAKTTWGNTTYLAHYIATHPDARVCLVSNTALQAYDFSRAIRGTFEHNEQFQELFGNLVSPAKWTNAEWLRRDSRWTQSSYVTMYAVGVGGAILGKRFDLIVCDDILDEENTINIDQRTKVETWFFKTLLPTLVPEGVVIVLGTRWGEDDLYQRLTDATSKGGRGWRLLKRQALDGPDGGPFTSYWPEHWPVGKLLEKKEELGSALFACAYQNDISGLMQGNIFRRPFRYFDMLDPSKHYTIRMGVDLASSEKERADYTARVTVAEDDEGNIYVLSVFRDKRETHHAEFVYEGWLAYQNMALVMVESQQFQSTLIQEVMRSYPRIPIEGKKSDVDKVTRARAVAAKYEAGKVFHAESLRDSDFEHEMLGFPKGHDDMVDALGFAMDLGSSGFFFGSLRV